jgi:thiamine-monophosphate kinase
MKVAELGEFGLIDLLSEMAYGSRDNRAASWQQLVLGIGDDAAAWQSDGSIQLATVDTLVQDVHFSLDTASWSEVGWRAMAANLSDIAAMGGVPRYALVSLALPAHTEVDDVTALYRGMIELAQQFGVAIVGGDTSSAPLVTITTTIFGSASNQDKHILTRSAARVSDKVAVTGYLGTAVAGWEMLTKQLQFDPETTACLQRSFLHPSPRIAEGQLLTDQGVKTAIDISDGLVSDLNHICQASQVGARIEVDHVPIQPAVRANFGDRALELALSGGEDYELLFTASTEVIDNITAIAHCPITVIGEIVADRVGEVILVDSKGNPVNLRSKGWEHFIAK